MYQEKLRVIASCLGSYRMSGDEILFHCPYCKHHKPKMSVNINSNVYKCWICDVRGKNIRRLIRKFSNYAMLAEWDRVSGRSDVNDFDNIFAQDDEDVIIQRVNLPEEFQTLTKDTLSPGTLPAVNYLKARGITKTEILKWKIGYCATGEYAGRIIIPSFDTEGYVNYFIARAYNGAWLRYKNPQASRDIVFNELYIDWGKDIVLVEGVFDAVVAGNAIPLLGSILNSSTGVFARIVEEDPVMYLALDADAADKERKIIKKLLQYDIEVYKIDTTGIEDVGAITKEQFEKRKNTAIKVKDHGYLLSDAVSSIRI